MVNHKTATKTIFNGKFWRTFSEDYKLLSCGLAQTNRGRVNNQGRKGGIFDANDEGWRTNSASAKRLLL